MSRARLPANTGATRRVGAALGLAFALLLAQWLGFVHAALHAPGATGARVAAAGADAAADAPLRALFAHAAGSDDCRLYDHLTHADPLVPVPPVVTAIATHPPRPAMPAQRLAAADGAPYAARGPPAG